MSDIADNNRRENHSSGEKNDTGFFKRLVDKVMKSYDYIMGGVWSDTRGSWKVNIMKTLSLTVKSFFNADLQTRAAALTYQTVLTIVPALALLFAIGRGFGFQNLLKSQLFSYMPAQRSAWEQALEFVDSYLAQASEGLFVGIGIPFLLWTLISLVSKVEECFNKIWGIPRGRSLWRKITDYTAIFLILPVLMICSSGITVFMSSTLQATLPFDFMSPVIGWLLDGASLVLTWLFFAGAYMLIPNTKVYFKNAFIAGILAGSSFLILQWLFVSGQIYVTKYNAIYGSFSLLPLLLIWLQLVWLITLAGALVCYSSQNIFQFSFSNEIADISKDYSWRITMAVLSAVVTRFVREQKPLSDRDLANTYGLPLTLVTDSANLLVACGLLQRVVIGKSTDVFGLAPAKDPMAITVGQAIKTINEHGNSGFIPDFDRRFGSVNDMIDKVEASHFGVTSEIRHSQLAVTDLLTDNKPTQTVNL